MPLKSLQAPGKSAFSNEVGRCRSFFLRCWPPRGTPVRWILRASILGGWPGMDHGLISKSGRLAARVTLQQVPQKQSRTEGARVPLFGTWVSGCLFLGKREMFRNRLRKKWRALGDDFRTLGPIGLPPSMHNPNSPLWSPYPLFR